MSKYVILNLFLVRRVELVFGQRIKKVVKFDEKRRFLRGYSMDSSVSDSSSDSRISGKK